MTVMLLTCVSRQHVDAKDGPGVEHGVASSRFELCNSMLYNSSVCHMAHLCKLLA
jgi:hypothetical protein